MKNEYFQTVLSLTLVLLVVIFLFTFMTLGFIRVVPTGSMCVVQTGGNCDGWTHPFAPSIHKGDILILLPVNPENLNANYPHSDVIVFDDPSGVPIVHRIVGKEKIDDSLYFYTKGDGNPPTIWPDEPSPYEYDQNLGNPLSSDQIIGKVVMRIPWIGHLAIFMQSIFGTNNYITIPIVAILIIFLIVFEFILPLFKRKKSSPTTTELTTTEL